MKKLSLILTLAAGLALPIAANAQSGMYASEDQAKQTCGSDDVVWVNLDRHRFYAKDHQDYGKGNGAYTCVKAARDHGYREAKSS